MALFLYSLSHFAKQRAPMTSFQPKISISTFQETPSYLPTEQTNTLLTQCGKRSGIKDLTNHFSASYQTPLSSQEKESLTTQISSMVRGKRKRKRENKENHVGGIRTSTETKKKKVIVLFEDCNIETLPIELKLNIYRYCADNLQSILRLRLVCKEVEQIANGLIVRHLHNRSLKETEVHLDFEKSLTSLFNEKMERSQKQFEEHMKKINHQLLPCTHLSFEHLLTYSEYRCQFFQKIAFEHSVGSVDTIQEIDTIYDLTILKSYYSFCKQPILCFDVESLELLEKYSTFLEELKVLFKPLVLTLDIDYTDENQNYQRRLKPFLTDELKGLIFYSDRSSLTPLPPDYIERILCGSSLPELRYLSLSLHDGSKQLGYHQDTLLTREHAARLIELTPHVTTFIFNEFSCSNGFMNKFAKKRLNEVQTLLFMDCFLESPLGIVELMSSTFTNLCHLMIPLSFKSNNDLKLAEEAMKSHPVLSKMESIYSSEKIEYKRVTSQASCMDFEN
jgi:hypothetical protein